MAFWTPHFLSFPPTVLSSVSFTKFLSLLLNLFTIGGLSSSVLHSFCFLYTSTSASLMTLKPLTVWFTTDWKILKEMGVLDHLTCFLRNLYAGQEATVRTRHETTDWFKTVKGVRHGCVLSPCLFNFCAEYVMQTAGLDDSQVGIKISRRNINNFRSTDDYLFISRKRRGTKEPLDEGKREE